MGGRGWMAVAVAVAVLAGAGTAMAAPGYQDGAFSLKLVERGAKGFPMDFPAGSRVSQVTLSDLSYPSAQDLFSAVGMRCELIFSFGEIFHRQMEGNLEMTGYMVFDPARDQEIFYFYGRFDLQVPADPAPYAISGLALGDQYTMYLVGNDSRGTADVGDDRLLLIRAIGQMEKMSVDKEVVGSARAMWSDGSGQPVADSFLVDPTAPGNALPLRTPLPAGTRFDQLAGPSFTLTAETDAAFLADGTFAGRVQGTGASPLPGDLATTFEQFTVTGGEFNGRGLFLGRFDLEADGGPRIQGFLLGDVDGTTLTGYVLSAAVGAKVPQTFLFGTLAASLADTDEDGAAELAGSVDAILHRMDSPPPEPLRVEEDLTLSTGEFRAVPTRFRDMNGWTDLVSVSVLAGPGRVPARSMALYNLAKDRLYLFLGKKGGWGRGCRPGEGRVLRTPGMLLDCGATAVRRTGEYLLVDWALKPSARTRGPLNIYTRALDRSLQSAGWRLATGGVEVERP